MWSHVLAMVVGRRWHLFHFAPLTPKYFADTFSNTHSLMFFMLFWLFLLLLLLKIFIAWGNYTNSNQIMKYDNELVPTLYFRFIMNLLSWYREPWYENRSPHFLCTLAFLMILTVNLYQGFSSTPLYFSQDILLQYEAQIKLAI